MIPGICSYSVSAKLGTGQSKIELQIGKLFTVVADDDDDEDDQDS